MLDGRGDNLRSWLHELRNHRCAIISLHLLKLALLFHNKNFVLESVFASKVLEVLDVLLVDLLENLLKVLSLGAFHVRVELALLLLRQQVDLIGIAHTALDFAGVAEQLRLSGKNLGNLLFLLP